MHNAKLSRKLFIQWYMLKLCKEYPHTSQELFDTIVQNIPLPSNSRGARAKTFTNKVTHSQSLTSRYIKDLVNKGMLVLAGEAFSITKTGHETEVTLRLNLRKRIQTVQQATKNMYDDLTTNKKVMESDIVVPPSDREFLRGVISVKNIVRYFALSELIRTKEETIVGIKDKMLMRYGWNCSKPYFYHVIRDELGDQSEIPEKVKANMTSEINEELANCVKGYWKGNRRNERFYRITDKGIEWIEVFRKHAIDDLKEAQDYFDTLLELLNT